MRLPTAARVWPRATISCKFFRCSPSCPGSSPVFVGRAICSMSRVLIVTVYGFRSNFLHLPLIFIFANVFDAEDIKKIGWWILLGMIPMGLIMAAQFQASPDSFINRTVGVGEGEQITAGRVQVFVRPAHSLSFPADLLRRPSALFTPPPALSRATYRSWLLIAAGSGIGLAIVVSGKSFCSCFRFARNFLARFCPHTPAPKPPNSFWSHASCYCGLRLRHPDSFRGGRHGNSFRLLYRFGRGPVCYCHQGIIFHSIVPRRIESHQSHSVARAGSGHRAQTLARAH